MPHHEVFSRFRQYCGEIDQGYHGDFLGTRANHDFLAGLNGFETRPEKRVVEAYSYPEFDEEYFEWIDLLESVVAAKGSYTMIELGAGFGRWAARAVYAAQQYNPELRCRVIAVEGEPIHYAWMKRHFLYNGINPDEHGLIHAAVTNQPGSVDFWVRGPVAGPFDLRPNAWYGQGVAGADQLSDGPRPNGKYCGFDVVVHKNGWQSIRIPGVQLKAILQTVERVDLIDLDIEGHELAALTAAADQLDAQVKRLHIGTHGKEIEAGLRELLSAHGWHCLVDYSLGTAPETPWGLMQFQNGVQSWTNPKL